MHWSRLPHGVCMRAHETLRMPPNGPHEAREGLYLFIFGLNKGRKFSQSQIWRVYFCWPVNAQHLQRPITDVLPWTTAAGWSPTQRQWCPTGAWWTVAHLAAGTGNTPDCRRCKSAHSAEFSARRSQNHIRTDTNSNKTCCIYDQQCLTGCVFSCSKIAIH